MFSFKNKFLNLAENTSKNVSEKIISSSLKQTVCEKTGSAIGFVQNRISNIDKFRKIKDHLSSLPSDLKEKLNKYDFNFDRDFSQYSSILPDIESTVMKTVDECRHLSAEDARLKLNDLKITAKKQYENFISLKLAQDFKDIIIDFRAGSPDFLQNEDAFAKFSDLIAGTESTAKLIFPWLTPTTKFTRKNSGEYLLRQLLDKGVEVYLIYGYKSFDDKGQERDEKSKMVADRLSKKYRNFHPYYSFTHEKIAVFDDKCVMMGSYNLLSRGNNFNDAADEYMIYAKNKKLIDSVLKKFCRIGSL